MVSMDALLNAAANDDVQTARCVLIPRRRKGERRGRLARQRAASLTRFGLSHCSVFLQHGANANVADEEGWRPLHHAAHYNSLRVMALLLAAPGVDVDAASNKR